jgi:hypothetical protein
MDELITDLEDIITPEFAIADAAAVTARSRLSHTRLIDLIGGAIVTVLGLVRLGMGDDARWASIGAAVVAGFVSVSAISTRRSQLDHWLDNRRTAEELRSLYFRHLVTSETVPREQRRRSIGIEVLRLTAGDDAETAKAEVSDGPPAQPLSADAWSIYVERRLRDQIDWMTSKVRAVDARTRALNTMQTILMAVAALCGAISAVVADPLGQALAVPIATTAGLVATLAAIDSVVASERLSTHYQRSIRRLQIIERSLVGATGTTHDVSEIEAVLMSEHRAWHRIAQESG